jgi:hypothetical protein
MKILKFKDFCEYVIESNITNSLSRIQGAVTKVQNLDTKTEVKIVSKLDDTAEYVEKFEHISQIHKHFVEEKGFSESDFESLKNVIQKDTDESLVNLTKYLNAPYEESYFTGISSPINLPAKMSKDTGISASTLSAIYMMEGSMKSGKGVGRGELFLGLMIKGAKNASKGDVDINGNSYEVKAKEARLNTQNGFGIGTPAMISFFDGLKTVDSNLHQKYGDVSKSNIQSYNFTKKGSRFYELFADAAKIGKLNEVFELMSNSLYCGPSGIWPKGDPSIKKAIVDNLKTNIRSNGSGDDAALNYGFMYINILYYQSQEHFNGIFLIDPKSGNFAYFNPQEKNGERWLQKNTK